MIQEKQKMLSEMDRGALRPGRSIVWIVILNWNGLADTMACLASLHQLETELAATTILVIDNGSFADPCATIRAEFPDTKTVRLDMNVGFAAGCNIGIQIAMQQSADHILLLNNDTIVQPQFLDPLLRHSQCYPRAGLVNPLICDWTHPELVAYAGGSMRMTFGYFTHQLIGVPRESVPTTTRKAEFVTGCCVLIARKVIEEVGLLDELLFAYFEDVDYSIRARKHGFEPVCVPESVIWHKESSSTKRNVNEGNTSPVKHYLMARNRIIIIKRHATIAQFVCFMSISNMVMTAFFLIAFCARQRWHKMIWYCLGVVHGARYCLNKPFTSLV